jgi:hypothetical protein
LVEEKLKFAGIDLTKFCKDKDLEVRAILLIKYSTHKYYQCYVTDFHPNSSAMNYTVG